MSKTDEESAIALLLFSPLVVLGASILVAGAILYDAFILRMLFGWFIGPSAPSYPLTIGFITMIHLVTREYPQSLPESQGTAMFHMIKYTIITPSLALLIGWIAHLFM